MEDAKRYEGEEKIILSLDVGTTQSAVSYSYLYPGSVPEVKMVTKWAGQPEAAGDSKIPTIVAYRRRNLIACGAEARDYIDDDEYQIAKWFKLHLHPNSMKVSHLPPAYGDASGSLPLMDIPPLPQFTSLKQVYVDFLAYLLNATRTFFENNTPNGDAIWTRLKADIVIILATPNGWDTTQHDFLRQASIAAKLVTKDKAEELLEFVTEGEASVHYTLARTLRQTWLMPDAMFAVIDAGGSTVDGTLYKCKALIPKLVLEEVHASECVQAGGVFVDDAAQTLLRSKLKNSRFGGDEFIGDMVNTFERKTKRIFDGSQESNIIEFGGRRDTEREYDILQGKITLKKTEIASMFDNVIGSIVDSCLKLLRGQRIKHLLLVGGFGESPYLRSRLKSIFRQHDTNIVTVDDPTKKAAAEGAGIWYIQQLVVGRAARFTIGRPVCPIYHQSDPEHRRRQHQTYLGPDGYTRIENKFIVMLQKDVVMSQGFEVTCDCNRQYDEPPTGLGYFTSHLYAWEGETQPEWLNDRDGNLLPQMRLLCNLRADLSGLESSLRAIRSHNNKNYWRVDYKIKILFGGTQIRARMQWDENDELREGPVRVLVNSTT